MKDRVIFMSRGVAFPFLKTENGTRIFISYKRERDRDIVTLFYFLTREMLNVFHILENENADTPIYDVFERRKHIEL
jgi:hypothetical protein